MKIIKLLFLLSIFCFLNANMIRVSENIIKDTKTNFLWEDTINVKTQKLSYTKAKEYCNALELDGNKNWEVPTFLAAFSIVDAKVYNPTLPKEFKNFVSDNYWTSKTFGHATSKEAFVVNYLSGAFNRELMDDKFYVRCYKDMN